MMNEYFSNETNEYSSDSSSSPSSSDQDENWMHDIDMSLFAKQMKQEPIRADTWKGQRCDDYVPVVDKQEEPQHNIRKGRRQIPSNPNNPHPRPNLSYTKMVAMALDESPSGCLPVKEIYKYMLHHYPYFGYTSQNWKNSVRHTLSTATKWFYKYEIESGKRNGRGTTIWGLYKNGKPKVNSFKPKKEEPSSFTINRNPINSGHYMVEKRPVKQVRRVVYVTKASNYRQNDSSYRNVQNQYNNVNPYAPVNECSCAENPGYCIIPSHTSSPDMDENARAVNDLLSISPEQWQY